MKHVKSERLKKLEAELHDLDQWLKLGLVPRKDIERHREEIQSLESKIEEEKERLQFLKESGELEEYVPAAKRVANTRTGYTEMPTLPDMDIRDTTAGVQESAFDMDVEAGESDHSVAEERETHQEEDQTQEDDADDEEDESYFSDRNRWRRGGIKDPDADEW